MIYLDNAATTMPDEQVLSVMSEVAAEYWGNPSSLYRLGFNATKRLEQSRKTVADAFGCQLQELYFTASGTESNNIAVLGAARARKNFGEEIVVSGYEHPSVFDTVNSLADEGFNVVVISPNKGGIIEVGDIVSRVQKKTALVAVMSVNNETGAEINVADLAKRVKEKNIRTAVHCDHVQGFMKSRQMLAGTLVDTASISAHKLHGPKGIGALYIRKGFNIKPVLHGGGQERGLRSGTENVAFAAAFAKALQCFDAKSVRKNAMHLNKMLRERLLAIDGVKIHSAGSALPFILNFSVLGFRSETMLHFLDEHGVLVSSGSACSKGGESRTLRSMSLSNSEIDSALRVSFSKHSTVEDVGQLVSLIQKLKRQLVGSL